MSYAQPSPPTIHTLLRTSVPAQVEQTRARRCRRIRCSAARSSRDHALALGADAADRRRRRCRRRSRRQQLGVDRSGELQPTARAASSAVRRCASKPRRMPRPNSALSSNRLLLHAGPRPSSSTRVRRGGQVAAVDAAAAGGVGDEQVVAEQLGEQLQVRRLAAAGARSAELEQRLAQLAGLHRCRVPLGGVGLVQARGTRPMRSVRRRGGRRSVAC